MISNIKIEGGKLCIVIFGKKNPDGAVFCKECGKNLSGMKDVVKNVPALPEQQETETVGDFDIFSCPSCRADSEFCYPVVKTNVKTSGGGYSFWNGCCGLILLGPLGLLCGACGGSVRTKVRSETWWVCRQCGKEFMSKQSALEKANTSMLMAALYSFFICWLIGNSIDGLVDFWILCHFCSGCCGALVFYLLRHCRTAQVGSFGIC